MIFITKLMIHLVKSIIQKKVLKVLPRSEIFQILIYILIVLILLLNFQLKNTKIVLIDSTNQIKIRFKDTINSLFVINSLYVNRNLQIKINYKSR